MPGVLRFVMVYDGQFYPCFSGVFQNLPVPQSASEDTLENMGKLTLRVPNS